MNKNVQTELLLARKDGVSHCNTCDASTWDGQFHDAMLLLQANPPEDIQVRCVIRHGIHEWTLIDLKPDSRKENPVNITTEEIDRMTDRRKPMEVFGAYQHFLYYFDQVQYEKEEPNGGLTNHFVEKLTGLRARHNDYNSIEVLVRWVQEMSQHNQADLLEYILKHHSNKW